MITVSFEKPERFDLLTDVSFAVEAGASTALVGPSGSGKTTLLRTVAGLRHPSNGNVRLGATSPYELSPAALLRFRAEHVGFIPQHPALVGHLTGLNNILLPLLDAPRHEREEGRARALDLVEKLDLSDCAGRGPSQLSGGQRQRICIARAMLKRPSVIVADEPTASLHREMGSRVLDVLLDSGSTILASTHDPRVVERFEHQEDVEQWQP